MAAHIMLPKVTSMISNIKYLCALKSIRRSLGLSSTTGTTEFTSRRVRNMFTEFFKERYGHRVVPSAPVRPRGDPSLLFVNAGMNQFKPVFLGTVDPRSEMARYRRVVNSQKCVRAGGKHNDLEDVGRDVYHHTFFEMLGNWSFGDYFKEEACAMAWQLLTDVYGIPKDRLYITHFGGDPALPLAADQETREIWLGLGVQPDHILPFGLKDNFWEMGETGPEADGSLRPLPQFSVDTGMGLERLLTVLQGKRSNYDTDLFTPLLAAIQECSQGPGYRGRTGEADVGGVDIAYRVLADHIRTLAVCIADGVYPGMSGAELVLRRILRRAVRFSAEVLQAPPGALASLVPTVVQVLGEAYPELITETERIKDIINDNEAQFLSSLRQGRRVIDRTLQKMENSKVFPGSVAWSLHRNLGFPLDLIGLMVEERGVSMETDVLDKFASEKAKLSAQARPSERESRTALDVRCLSELKQKGVPATDDSLKYAYTLGQDGRYVFPPCQATVLELYCGMALVEEVPEGQQCGVILDRTYFYAEQGGQAADQGYFTRDGLQDVLFPVEDVWLAGGYVVHEVTTAETLRRGDQVQLFVDEALRLACMVKHTATHILNFALRQVLGEGVEQRGSHVTPDRLRFDFSVKEALSTQQLQQVEYTVLDVIWSDDWVHTEELPLGLAKGLPGLRTVDEMYPDPVRVVSVRVPPRELLESPSCPQTSVELCCGTHLQRTGEIKDLVIVAERQLVKGISRIVAVTGEEAREAREAARPLAQEVESLSARLGAASPSLSSAHRLSKEVGQLTDVRSFPALHKGRPERDYAAAKKVQALLKRHTDKRLVVDTVDTDSISVVMKTVNQYSDQSPGASVMLLSHLPSGRVLCACQVPKGSRSLSASEWALAVCTRLGGNAGGSATVAKGTGTAQDIGEALRWAQQFAQSKAAH
nr:PREDICTED: alanine--tRNA ligase, mitochondrial [Lepisosteus oculatus]